MLARKPYHINNNFVSLLHWKSWRRSRCLRCLPENLITSTTTLWVCCTGRVGEEVDACDACQKTLSHQQQLCESAALEELEKKSMLAMLARKPYHTNNNFVSLLHWKSWRRVRQLGTLFCAFEQRCLSTFRGPKKHLNWRTCLERSIRKWLDVSDRDWSVAAAIRALSAVTWLGCTALGSNRRLSSKPVHYVKEDRKKWKSIHELQNYPTPFWTGIVANTDWFIYAQFVVTYISFMISSFF